MSTVEREEGGRRRSDVVEMEDETTGRARVVENVAVTLLQVESDFSERR
jgi:hypothetical protein